jgi:hypothetical protein
MHSGELVVKPKNWAGGKLALGHETTPIAELLPAEPAGSGRVDIRGWAPPLVLMKHTQTFVLALLGSSAVLVIVQFTIREQMNRCLPPDQRIGVRDLPQNPFIWFGEHGLLARHASLYPGRRLPAAFRLLRAAFWVRRAASILAR